MKTIRNYLKQGFWKNETCEYCEGKLQEKHVELLRKGKRGYYIFEHVPAAVCQECGVRYYTANTLKNITQRLNEPQISRKQIKVSLLNLAAA